MTDLRETVRGIVARLQHRDNAAEASAATDAIMSEIAKARVKVKLLEWEVPEEDDNPPSCRRVTFDWIGGWAEVHFSEGRAWAQICEDGGTEIIPASDQNDAERIVQERHARRIMDAVEIVSEATTTHLRHAIKRTCAELRHQAEKARQREGDYDILITRAELLERALKDTESAPQKTQSAEGTPEATQAAPVVTDAMVEAAAKALWCDRYPKHDPSEWGREDHPVRKIYFRKARAALTAALPHAKTEAQVRAEAESDLIEALIASFGGHETEYGDTIAEILEPYRPRPKDKTDD